MDHKTARKTKQKKKMQLGVMKWKMKRKETKNINWWDKKFQNFHTSIWNEMKKTKLRKQKQAYFSKKIQSGKSEESKK